MCNLRSPFFLSLCRFKGIRTVTARLSLIRRSLLVFRLWGSPVHRIPHAVITLTIHYDQQLHTAIIQYFSVNNSCVWEWLHVVVEIAMNSQEVKIGLASNHSVCLPYGPWISKIKLWRLSIIVLLSYSSHCVNVMYHLSKWMVSSSLGVSCASELYRLAVKM